MLSEIHFMGPLLYLGKNGRACDGVPLFFNHDITRELRIIVTIAEDVVDSSGKARYGTLCACCFLVNGLPHSPIFLVAYF